jgi:hypothetical protein
MKYLVLAAIMLAGSTIGAAAPFEHYDATPSEWDCGPKNMSIAIYRDNRAYEVTVAAVPLGFTEIKITVSPRGRIALNGRPCKKMQPRR